MVMARPCRRCSRTRLGAIACAAAGFVIAFTAIASASFTSSVTGGGTPVTTKRVFPGSRTLVISDVRDASSGGEADSSDPLAAAGDGRMMTTSNWANAFSAARYVDFDYPASLPGGLAVSGAAFNLTFASVSNNTTCHWFEVRSRASGAVIGTHGSAVSPVACTTTAFVSTSTPLPELATTDAANDLRVRVYGRNSANRASLIDVATVSGTSPYAGFTLSPVSVADASSGTAVTTPWSLAATGDGSVYTSAANWRATADAARYLRLAVPASVPTGAVVTGATFTHTYKDQDGGSACYYLEVYAGAAVVGTHGSAAAPYCNNTAAYITDTIALPEVGTPAIANSLVLRLYTWNSGGIRRTQHDQASVTLSWYLD